MGAWGTGNFDNDTACDWVAEVYDPVESDGGLGLVQSILDEVLGGEGGPLDSDLGCCGLAACEVVARLSGKGGESDAYTESLDAWVQANPAMIPAELTAKALQVIQRILSPDSELVELWGGDEDWHQAVDGLRARLQGESQSPAPKIASRFSLVPPVGEESELGGHEENQLDLASLGKCPQAQAENAEEMKALEKKVLDVVLEKTKQNMRRDAGSDGDVTPAAGDLIGIPLAGGDFALAVLLSTGFLDDLEGLADYCTGLMAITDCKQSQAEELEVNDPTELNFVDARSVLVGPVRLGEWPVIRSGVSVQPIQQDLESRSGVALSTLQDSFEGAIVLQDYVNHLHGRPTSFGGASHGNLFD